MSTPVIPLDLARAVNDGHARLEALEQSLATVTNSLTDAAETLTTLTALAAAAQESIETLAANQEHIVQTLTNHKHAIEGLVATPPPASPTPYVVYETDAPEAADADADAPVTPDTEPEATP